MREALRGVLDPEIGIDVVALGLVQTIAIEAGDVRVEMGVTSPTCPMGPHLAETAAAAIRALPGVSGAEVVIVHDPPWTPDRLSEEARRTLGW